MPCPEGLVRWIRIPFSPITKPFGDVAKAVVVAVLVAIVAGSASAALMTCSISKKLVCDGATCQEVAPTIRVELDSETGFYRRCDDRGCDNLQLFVATSGQYSNLTLPAGGFIAKVNFDGSEFLEVATLGTQTFILRRTELMEGTAT
ncbi:MAG: hypothetical protein IH905_02220 [Proteobacteria bacterium]|nr:hypothetical protein [Pseudomonadota bacterium]